MQERKRIAMTYEDLNKDFPRDRFDWRGGQAVNTNTGTLKEAIIGHNNLKDLYWFSDLLKAASKVAIVMKKKGYGSGFLIGPNLFMTNNHVFPDSETASNSELAFEYFISDKPSIPIHYKLDPDQVFHTNAALDYTIVAIKCAEDNRPGDRWGYFDVKKPVEIEENQRLNIIQHPEGKPKQVAFRDNQLKYFTDSEIQYVTDTEYGSSGSPVLDDDFNLVGLHAERVPDPDAPDTWYRNKGFRMEAIYPEISNYLNANFKTKIR